MPGDSVGYTFTAGGMVGFDAALGAAIDITVKLMDGAATVDTKTVTLPIGTMLMPWSVSFTVSRDYEDATVSASLPPPGGGAAIVDEVQNIDIDDNCGGIFNFFLPLP
jgi:hypothetical protein